MEPLFLNLTEWQTNVLVTFCIIAAICLAVFCIIEIACGKATSKAGKEREKHYDRFYCVDSDIVYELYGLYSTDILVDKETRVQYFANSMAPWVDADGKPILYTGDFNEPHEE
jgi:hypothetical protein